MQPTATVVAVATAPKAVEELLLGCNKRSLVLNDVLIRSGRVALNGSAAKSFVGKKVAIVFDGGKPVVTATVQANGQFSTTAPLPPTKLRDSNSARYLAESGGQRSLDLKLTRRVSLEPPSFSGGTVTLSGQVVAPLGKPISPVTVEQQLECGKIGKVVTFTPEAGGHFRVTIPGIPERQGRHLPVEHQRLEKSRLTSSVRDLQPAAACHSLTATRCSRAALRRDRADRGMPMIDWSGWLGGPQRACQQPPEGRSFVRV